MSLVSKIRLELKQRNETFSYKNKLLCNRLISDQDVIVQLVSSHKPLLKLKSNTGKMNFLMRELIDCRENEYAIFKEISNKLDFDFSLIDFLSLHSATSFLFSGCKFFNVDKSNTILDLVEGNYRKYFFVNKSIINESKYNTLALMADPDVISHLFSMMKKESKKHDCKKYFSLCYEKEYRYDFLCKFLPREQVESYIRVLNDSEHDFFDSSDTCFSGMSREDSLKRELSMFNAKDLDNMRIFTESDWLEHLNASIENSLVDLTLKDKIRNTNQLKLLYRNKKTENGINTYKNVVIVDAEDQRVIASAITVSTMLSIEDLVAAEIKNNTTYDVESVQEDECGYILSLKNIPAFESLLDISKKISTDSAISVASANFVCTVDSNTVVLAFVCSDHSNCEESARSAIEKDMDMLGELSFIDKETVFFFNGYKYYYEVKLNQKDIDKFNAIYNPINKLEKGLKYQVTNDSFGLKEGTIFTYNGPKDQWRDKLYIVSGDIIHDSGEIENVSDFNYETYKFSRNFDIRANTIPSCKVI